MRATRPLNPEDYRISIIAVTLMLDNRHRGRFPTARGYEYLYTPGEMGGHNVIIATLPAGEDFGVAAGMPKLGGDQERDIRLGDVLVALQDGKVSGLINLELGKWTENGFVLRRGGWMDTTHMLVRSAITQIKAGDFFQDQPSFLKHYQEMMAKLAAPRRSTIRAKNGTCYTKLTGPWWRESLENLGSVPAYENASKRDELRDKHNLLGIETAAAGVVPKIPVGVVRGVCDYADEETKEAWRPYAAAMAAAYAKEILLQIGPPERPKRACPTQRICALQDVKTPSTTFNSADDMSVVDGTPDEPRCLLSSLPKSPKR
ncbi:hypothetical protein J3458_019705 [Metarhizium acridum]|uniref:uncharacterized protein n=1 Tax=Metarhizium acridum TaxID=92637 RepID=UPI001C6ADCE1|nr:hypothetical protein J3458_019705 [Metarhizium acridum]